MTRRPNRVHWMKVVVASAATWLGGAGFVNALGFENWNAITSATIVTGVVFILGALAIHDA